ncbi:MAG: DUF3096 domain-containing protein [Acidimicrobiia bacterium]
MSFLALFGEVTADVDVTLALNGVVALAAGVLIFVIPRVLKFIIAGYLIVIGLIEVFDITI